MSERFVPIYPRPLDDLGLRLDERGALTHLLQLVDHKTGDANYTLGALAERMGAHPVTLRKILDKLAGKGLVTYRFPKGHMGQISVPSYPDLVHLSTSQRESFALRNAGISRCDNEGADHAITRRDRVTSAKGSRYEQDRLSGLAHTAAGEAADQRDTVSASQGEPDAPLPRDEDLEVEEIPITSHASLRATPQRGSTQVAARDEQQSPGLGSASSSMSRGSDGGGSESTPVHPRSRSRSTKASSPHVLAERDARATADEPRRAS